MANNVSRLNKIADLRSVWPREDSDFTPWLAEDENLDLLAETLGLGSLDRIRQEVPVGTFWADIICRDANDHQVVIENQIARSDHKHLGQLLTYLAGTEDARTVVWITEKLKDEHRAALDWLNANTETEFAFFGVEIELWTIGGSLPAPKFEVVSRPNDWTRQKQRASRAASDETEDHQRRGEYWTALIDQWQPVTGIRPPAKGPGQGWMKFAFTGDQKIAGSWIGIFTYRSVPTHVGCYLSLGQIVGVSLDDIAARFAQFPAISACNWQVNQSGNVIALISQDGDALDDRQWAVQHDWMVKQVQSIFHDWTSGARQVALSLLQEVANSGAED